MRPPVKWNVLGDPQTGCPPLAGQVGPVELGGGGHISTLVPLGHLIRPDPWIPFIIIPLMYGLCAAN